GVMIGRGCEFPARTRVPMRYSRKRQILLALEMVEEASLGQAGFGADILYPGGGGALGADHHERRLQEFCLRFMMRLRHRFHTYWLVHSIPTNRYGSRAIEACLCPRSAGNPRGR